MDNKGVVSSLGDFLFSQEHQYEIQMLRHLSSKEERDSWKRKLPQTTVGGVFQPTRSIQNIKYRSGLICVDMDAKENPAISDWNTVKEQLAVIPQIAYCSLSVSGVSLRLFLCAIQRSFVAISTVAARFSSNGDNRRRSL